MNDILNSLSASGDWKIALGAVILAVAQWLIKKYLSPAQPQVPGPAPAPPATPETPKTTPLLPNPDGTPKFPVLNRLKEFLKGLPWKELGPILLPLILENKAKEKAGSGFESKIVAGQVETYSKEPLDAEDRFWKAEVKKALED